MDNGTVPQVLVTAVENDDSPYSYARAFLAASLIPDADLSVLFDQIEDIVAQADETPTTLYVCYFYCICTHAHVNTHTFVFTHAV